MAYRPEFWNRRKTIEIIGKSGENTRCSQKYHEFYGRSCLIPLPKVWTERGKGILSNMMIDCPDRQELEKWGIKYKIETGEQRNLNVYIPLDVVHDGSEDGNGFIPETRWRFDRREMKTYLKTMNNQDGLPAPIQGPNRGGVDMTAANQPDGAMSSPGVVRVPAALNTI